MGLDMYLYKMPRVADLTPQKMDAIAQIHENRVRVANGREPWCGLKEVPGVPKEIVEDLIAGATVSYPAWDQAKDFPNSSLMTKVGYWRKANQIHRWFVDRVQEGEDDCEIHDEVTREVLEELQDICKEIIESTVMVSAKIENGMHYDFDSQSWNAIMEDGKAILNAEVCERLLPTQDGFFFGGTGYDQYYLEDITYTYELCEKLLKETDFENEMLVYQSSW